MQQCTIALYITSVNIGSVLDKRDGWTVRTRDGRLQVVVYIASRRLTEIPYLHAMM